MGEKNRNEKNKNEISRNAIGRDQTGKNPRGGDRKPPNWKKDILAGIVVALVSIPISMGYAQIAGLPAVYGLYGSVPPILIYGLLTTSPQFVVGVDAMPAAMVGGMLTAMGYAAESPEAMPCRSWWQPGL